MKLDSRIQTSKSIARLAVFGSNSGKAYVQLNYSMFLGGVIEVQGFISKHGCGTVIWPVSIMLAIQPFDIPSLTP